ncbi:esterase/lipase family protein [Halomarina litorea]|uniref:esterase/lipase family protein n=1 Tax=Halomarina litorea TaxID=2961595 RepID=UPI0020C57590|nr:alpha/beta fold hydrolase [Halomarina sp. BCD28]
MDANREGRDGPPGDEPVLLVHGYGDTGHSPWWRTLADHFYDSGYTRDAVETLSLGWLPGTTVGSPERYARRIGRAVERLRDRHDSRVDVVAHSMGGLGVRWYVEREDGAPNVHDLVTLGTPHQGTALARAGSWTPGGRAMLPGSDFLRTLNGRRLPRAVNYTAVWSEDDEAVLPGHRARLPFTASNVRNVRVRGPGHIGLVTSHDVFDSYAETL